MSHQLSLINFFIFKFFKIMCVCLNNRCWVCAQVRVSRCELMTVLFFLLIIFICVCVLKSCVQIFMSKQVLLRLHNVLLCKLSESSFILYTQYTKDMSKHDYSTSEFHDSLCKWKHMKVLMS
jgi:hypothetical protein